MACIFYYAYVHIYLPHTYIPIVVSYCGDDEYLLTTTDVRGQIKVLRSDLTPLYSVSRQFNNTTVDVIYCSKQLPIAIVLASGGNSDVYKQVLWIENDQAIPISLPGGDVVGLHDNIDSGLVELCLTVDGYDYLCCFDNNAPAYYVSYNPGDRNTLKAISCSVDGSLIQWSYGDSRDGVVFSDTENIADKSSCEPIALNNHLVKYGYIRETKQFITSNDISSKNANPPLLLAWQRSGKSMTSDVLDIRFSSSVNIGSIGVAVGNRHVFVTNGHTNLLWRVDSSAHLIRVR